MKERYFNKYNIQEISKQIKDRASQYARGKSFVWQADQSALLVLDMQKVFLSDESKAHIPSSEAILPGIDQLVSVCRDNNIPIIYTRHINDSKNAGMMSSWWHRLIEKEDSFSKLIYKGNLHIIEKPQYDAFYKTSLEKTLSELGKNQLILCGIMTNLCCETTLRSAFVRGFQAVLPIDTTATYNRDLHQSSISNLAMGFCPPMLSGELIKQIKK
ncbi:MAG: isochorismatase family protein [Bacteroidales bacterium]|nr:isochorismatase family protein [Bacteroidales bacterium]